MKLSSESALFVGDTHADVGWLKFVVLPTAVKMGITTIIQPKDPRQTEAAPQGNPLTDRHSEINFNDVVIRSSISHLTRVSPI